MRKAIFILACIILLALPLASALKKEAVYSRKGVDQVNFTGDTFKLQVKMFSENPAGVLKPINPAIGLAIDVSNPTGNYFKFGYSLRLPSEKWAAILRLSTPHPMEKLDCHGLCPYRVFWPNYAMYFDWQDLWDSNFTVQYEQINSTEVWLHLTQNFTYYNVSSNEIVYIDPILGNNINQQNYSFIVDNTNPAINLTAPANNKKFGTYNVSFWYNMQDNHTWWYNNHKVNCTLYINGTNNQSQEFEQNLARNATPHASTILVAAYNETYAIDGSWNANQWGSSMSDSINQWLYLDLGRPYRLDSLIAHWWAVQGSFNWTVQYSATNTPALGVNASWTNLTWVGDTDKIDTERCREGTRCMYDNPRQVDMNDVLARHVRIWQDKGRNLAEHVTNMIIMTELQVLKSHWFNLSDSTRFRAGSYRYQIGCYDSVGNYANSTIRNFWVNSPPTRNKINITPFQTAYKGYMLNGTFNITDANTNQTLNVTFCWFTNHRINKTYCYGFSTSPYKGITRNRLYNNNSLGIPVLKVVEGQNWTLQVNITDGINMVMFNSSTIMINKSGVPSAGPAGGGPAGICPSGFHMSGGGACVPDIPLKEAIKNLTSTIGDFVQGLPQLNGTPGFISNLINATLPEGQARDAVQDLLDGFFSVGRRISPTYPNAGWGVFFFMVYFTVWIIGFTNRRVKKRLDKTFIERQERRDWEELG